jgi:hypothetical protein
MDHWFHIVASNNNDVGLNSCLANPSIILKPIGCSSSGSVLEFTTSISSKFQGLSVSSKEQLRLGYD